MSEDPVASLAVGESQCYTLLSEQPSFSNEESAATGEESLHAVLVVHGMGQQATFSTLTEVADGIERELHENNWNGIRRTARRVCIGDQRLSRVEITATHESKRTAVHVYEAYWAPLTEGRVTLTDVARFLFNAGLRGWTRSSHNFERWAFGAMQSYEPVAKTPLYLLIALAILAALAVINATVGAVTLSAVTAGAIRQKVLLRDLNITTSLLVAPLLSLAAILVAADRWKKASREPFGSFRGFFVWFQFGFGALSLLACAAHFAYLAWWHRGTPDTMWWAAQPNVNALVFTTLVISCIAVVAIVFALIFRDSENIAWALRLAEGAALASIVAPLAVVRFGSGPGPCPIASWPVPWAWGLLIGVTLMVRQLFVQFVGDVAAYVTPQSLDKFNELREEIKSCVLRTGKAVYYASVDGRTPLYAGVTIVGHSLGSVVSYDLLNRLLTEDFVSGGRAGVLGRTRALVTFGSPLDKTAFLFALPHSSDTAYALAATVQPLIATDVVRTFDWINIHSPYDIISGPLDYYDPAPGIAFDGKRVKNINDADCNIPLIAHVEYWKNRTLWNRVVASFLTIPLHTPPPQEFGIERVELRRTM